MLADSPALPSSPWANDQMLLPKEVYKFCSPDMHNLDTDIAALEEEIQKVSHRRESNADMCRMQTSLSSTSCGTSLAGSECSDDPYVDIESDTDRLFSVIEDQECLTSSLLSMLGGHSVADTPLTLADGGLPLMTGTWDEPDCDIGSLNDLVSNSLQTDLSQYDTISSVSAPCSPQPQRKRCHSPLGEKKPLSASKSWCSLTNTQQVSVIEDLTKVISSEMGLREQMEVIRIINPSASVSNNDTEFVIDLDCLNDEKLRRIRDLVKQHSTSRSHEGSGSSCVSDSSSDCGSPHQKKLTKRQRRGYLKEQRQRQRKEYRQMMKEKKSGLFQREEVLALSTASPTDVEDDDIDILV